MIRTFVRRLSAAVCVLLLASCADTSAPTAVEPQFGVTSSSPDVSAIARYQDGAPAVQFAWTKTWIGPAGGSARLLDFEIIVPPGAVSKVTLFEIRLPMDRSGAERAMAEFRPHNVTFAQPITIRLPYRGTTAEGSTTKVLWWDGVQWVPFTTTQTLDGRIETQTLHFSTYGTEEPQRGITPVGG